MITFLALVHMLNATQQDVSLGLVHMLNATQQDVSLGLVHMLNATQQDVSLGLVHMLNATQQDVSLGLVHMLNGTQQDVSLGLVHMLNATQQDVSLGLVHMFDATQLMWGGWGGGMITFLALVHMLNATQQDVSLGLVHMLNATQWRWYFLQLPSHCVLVPWTLYNGSFFLKCLVPTCRSVQEAERQRLAESALLGADEAGIGLPSLSCYRTVQPEHVFFRIDVQASPIEPFGEAEVVDGGWADTKPLSPDHVWRWYFLQLPSHCVLVRWTLYNGSFFLKCLVPTCRSVQEAERQRLVESALLGADEAGIGLPSLSCYRTVQPEHVFFRIDVQASPIEPFGEAEVVDGGWADTKPLSPDHVWRWYFLQLPSHCVLVPWTLYNGSFFLKCLVPTCRSVQEAERQRLAESALLGADEAGIGLPSLSCYRTVQPEHVFFRIDVQASPIEPFGEAEVVDGGWADTKPLPPDQVWQRYFLQLPSHCVIVTWTLYSGSFFLKCLVPTCRSVQEAERQRLAESALLGADEAGIGLPSLSCYRTVQPEHVFFRIDVQASPIEPFGEAEVVDGGWADTKPLPPDQVWQRYFLQLPSHCVIVTWTLYSGSFFLSLSSPLCDHVVAFRTWGNKGWLNQPDLMSMRLALGFRV